MWDILASGPFIAAAITATVTILIFLLTPIRDKLVSIIFDKTPKFMLSNYIVDEVTTIEITPINRHARKKNNLSLIISDVRLPNILNVVVSKNTPAWKLNFLDEGIPLRLINLDGDNILRFYFNGRPEISEPHKVIISNRFIETLRDKTAILVSDTVSCKDTAAFFAKLRSKRSIFIDCDTINVSETSDIRSPHIDSTQTHDGFDLTIKNINGMSVSGIDNHKLLSDHSYSWVLRFSRCRDISFSGTTFGHTIAGYCTGGVLYFEHCSQLRFNGCDFFGSGTYAFEIRSCVGLVFENSTFRECTYGIGSIDNSQKVIFRNCRFLRNGPFEGIRFSGVFLDIEFIDCVFEANGINYMDQSYKIGEKYPMISINSYGVSKRPPITMKRTSLVNNGYSQLCDLDGFIEMSE